MRDEISESVRREITEVDQHLDQLAALSLLGRERLFGLARRDDAVFDQQLADALEWLSS